MTNQQTETSFNDLSVTEMDAAIARMDRQDDSEIDLEAERDEFEKETAKKYLLQVVKPLMRNEAEKALSLRKPHVSDELIVDLVANHVAEKLLFTGHLPKDLLHLMGRKRAILRVIAEREIWRLTGKSGAAPMSLSCVA